MTVVLIFIYTYMALLQVRNVSDPVRRVLKARAAAQGLSMNAYLLHLLEREAARPTVREVLDRAARRSGGATASAVDVLESARRERDLPMRAGPGE